MGEIDRGAGNPVLEAGLGQVHDGTWSAARCGELGPNHREILLGSVFPTAGAGAPVGAGHKLVVQFDVDFPPP